MAHLWRHAIPTMFHKTERALQRPLQSLSVEIISQLALRSQLYSYLNFSGARQSTTGVTSIFNPQIPTQMEIGFTQPLLNGLGRRVNERFIRVARNEVRFNDS